MPRRVLGLALALVLTAIAFYLSRYWTPALWGNGGLFGIAALRPQGELVERWLGGTALAPFDILVWAVGTFLALSAVQAVWTRLFRH